MLELLKRGMNFSEASLGGPPCLVFPAEPDKCVVIVFIKRMNASLSVTFSVIMLLIIYIFKFYQVFAYRLVTYLTIATLFDCIIYLLGEPQENSPMCLFEAFWLTYSDWNVLLWIVSITVYLYFYVVKSINTQNYEILYLVACFALPLLPAALPFAGNAYGPAGAWCWVTHTAWRMAVWFAPALATHLAELAAYAVILARIRRHPSGASSDAAGDVQREQVYPLLAYPCVFLALELLPFANRISNAVAPDRPVFALFILSAVSAPIIGTVNFFLFYLNPVVRKKATLGALLIRLRASRQDESLVLEYPPQQEIREA